MRADGVWREQEPERRRWKVLQAFVLTVLATGLCALLAGLLLWGLGVGGAALWNHFWSDFA